jgi:predicted nucleotide-binding protein with TIR-like domain
VQTRIGTDPQQITKRRQDAQLRVPPAFSLRRYLSAGLRSVTVVSVRLRWLRHAEGTRRLKSGALGGAERLIPTTRRVLLIHGHDHANLHLLADLLRERALEPIILRREPAKGRTLTEKFEQEASTCAFAFVLMTPDDQVKIAAPKEHQTETETLTERPKMGFVAEVRAEAEKMR